MKRFRCLKTTELRLWLVLSFVVSSISLSGQSIQVQVTPNNLVQKVGDEFEVSIQIETNGSQVSAVQIAMAFDPEIIEVISVNISEDNPLGNVLPGQNTDNTSGTILVGSFSIAPVEDDFDYATLKCIAKKQGQTGIKFLSSERKSTQFSHRGKNIVYDHNGAEVLVK